MRIIPQLVGNMSAVTSAPGLRFAAPGDLSLMLGEKTPEAASEKITEI